MAFSATQSHPPSPCRRSARRRSNVVTSAAKELHFNRNMEALKRMQAGADKLATVVGVTLGPKVRAILEAWRLRSGGSDAEAAAIRLAAATRSSGNQKHMRLSTAFRSAHGRGGRCWQGRRQQHVMQHGARCLGAASCACWRQTHPLTARGCRIFTICALQHFLNTAWPAALAPAWHRPCMHAHACASAPPPPLPHSHRHTHIHTGPQRGAGVQVWLPQDCE